MCVRKCFSPGLILISNYILLIKLTVAISPLGSLIEKSKSGLPSPPISCIIVSSKSSTKVLFAMFNLYIYKQAL